MVCRLRHRALHIVYLACLSIHMTAKKVYITPELNVTFLLNRRKNTTKLFFPGA